MEALALIKYGEVVRDLAVRGGDWRFYDIQLCNLQQTSPSEMPWDSTHWELWIPFVPRGFCRKFHRGTECQGCNSQHKCFKCGIIHPAVWCNFRPSRAAFNSTPSAAKSRAANASSH